MRRGIVVLLALGSGLVTALAQTATPEPGGTPATVPGGPMRDGKRPWFGGGRPGEGGGPNAAAFENVRKAVEALSPEQRKRFAENMLRWSNLPPEEKKALRDREEMRKKIVEDETNAAIQESGLQLNPERREEFIKRYMEGRRQIEEQLRAEMMEKRKPLVHELVNRLKTEFAAGGAPTAPSPSQSQTIQTVAPTAPAKP